MRAFVCVWKSYLTVIVYKKYFFDLMLLHSWMKKGVISELLKKKKGVISELLLYTVWIQFDLDTDLPKVF